MKIFKLTLINCIDNSCPEFRHGALIEELKNSADRFICFCKIDTEINAFYTVGDVDWVYVSYFNKDLDFDSLKEQLILNAAMGDVVEKHKEELRDAGVSIVRFSF